MKTIKLYWQWLVAGIVALFGIVAITQSHQSNKKLKKTAKKIDDNNQLIDNTQGKIEVIDQQITNQKEKIARKKEILSKLKTQKETVKIKPADIVDVKQNILNKIRKSKK
jgi:septal ring factor EnvC (AmiA/AmiB activator)